MNPATASTPAVPNARANPRSSLACLPCRSKHLKCDGNRPHCSRCTKAARQCDYAQSRRGGLDRAALAERRRRLAAQGSSQLPFAAPPRQEASSRPARDEFDFTSAPGLPNMTSDSTSPGEPQVHVGSTIENDVLIDSYYNNFHALHPFVLPQRHLTRLYQDPSRQPGFKPLIAILRFIGRIYSSQEWSSPLREYAEACFSEAPTADPTMVQCRLLYSIALFWHGYKDDAKREMDAAAKLALDLQMFRKEFAVKHGAQDPVLTECWRRTWWMVYILDGYYAGTLGTMNFAVFDVEATAELPCEEFAYESGEIPEPQTLDDFNCRDLAPEGTTFSSFAYLIGAIKCSALAISTAPKTATKEDSTHVIQAADSIINGWLLLLPKGRKQVMNKAGEIDELMFQAHLLVHVATIGFHRPLSDLKFNAAEDVSSCARDPPADTPTPELINVHTIRVLRSVEAQIRLLALPMKQFHHTPFTTCMVSEGTLALLSACNFLLKGKELAIARDQIRMTIGCLKALGELWPRTARNVQEIQAIARHVLGLGSKATTSDGTPNSSDVPSLSSGKQASIEPEAEIPGSDTDLFSSFGPIEDLCGWYNPDDLGQDLSWWVNSQS